MHVCECSCLRARGSLCGGGCSFASRSLCLLAEVSVCLSQVVWALPGPPRPHAVFWGARLWAHPAVLRADAADVAGPQLCRLPGEGEGLQSAPPIMAAKCQGEGMGTGWEGGPVPATPHPGRPPSSLCSWLGLFPLPGSCIPSIFPSTLRPLSPPPQLSSVTPSSLVPGTRPPPPRPPARSPSLILQNNLFMETEKKKKR